MARGVRGGGTRVMQSRDLIIAADFGTSGVKVGLVGRNMRREATATENYPTSLPQPGWAEQAPDDWWTALVRAVAQLSKEVPDLRDRCAGIVCCAQMCGLVCTDGDGVPLRPCLIWLDKRSSDLIRDYVSGLPTAFGYNVVKLARWLSISNGAPAMSGVDAPGKILWLQKHEPDVWKRTERILDVGDWIVLRATGNAVTSPDRANVSWMADTRPGRLGWAEAFTRPLGVAHSCLPKITEGSEVAGELTEAAAGELGLVAGLPVFTGCGDVNAAALGSGALGSGELHIYAGTSSWIGGFYETRRLNPIHKFATITSAAENRPLLISTQESCGSCLEWVAGLVDPTLNEAELEDIMESALTADIDLPPMFLPWLAGERSPVDDNRLRGAFIGLSLNDGRDSTVRAVLEGVALNLRWAFDAVKRQRGTRRDAPVHLVGGLAGHAGFCQLLSNCLNQDIAVVEAPNYAGVRGVSRLAATGLGWVDNPWQADDRKMIEVSPEPDRVLYFNERMDEFKHAYRRISPWMRRSSRGYGDDRSAWSEGREKTDDA